MVIFNSYVKLPEGIMWLGNWILSSLAPHSIGNTVIWIGIVRKFPISGWDRACPKPEKKTWKDRICYCGWLRNPNHQLKTVVYPIIYRVLNIPNWWCRISSINKKSPYYLGLSDQPEILECVKRHRVFSRMDWTNMGPGQSFKPWNCLDKSPEKTPINNLSHEDLWMVDWWIHETTGDIFI